MNIVNDNSRVFDIYPSIEMKPITFKNRFGIQLGRTLVFSRKLSR